MKIQENVVLVTVKGYRKGDDWSMAVEVDATVKSILSPTDYADMLGCAASFLQAEANRVAGKSNGGQDD